MLVMHGWSMTDDAMRSGTNMDSLAGAQQNAIVVYPDGIGVGALSCWSIPNMANLGQCSFDAGIDDVGFWVSEVGPAQWCRAHSPLVLTPPRVAVCSW